MAYKQTPNIHAHLFPNPPKITNIQSITLILILIPNPIPKNNKILNPIANKSSNINHNTDTNYNVSNG